MAVRRSYGSGSLYVRAGTWYGHWRVPAGQQIKRRIGLVRTPHKPDGLTKTQAEARLRDLIVDTTATTATEHARTLEAAAEGWLTHLAATGAKATSIRAYRAALNKWFLPALKTRSLDRITTSDIEHAMRRMRDAGRSDKSIRNYVGVIRALFNFAMDKRRRWTTRNPAADIDLPKIPAHSEIRYLTTTEVWALVDHAQPGPYQDLDRALYLTAAMTGMRIGELQALDWHAVDFVHARIRVRRTWDRKTKTFTTPKSRRSERAIPMPDDVAGQLDRLYQQSDHQGDKDRVFADPLTGEPLGHRRMYERLREALNAAGLDEAFGFHSLRHSYGTALAAQGVPMRTLQVDGTPGYPDDAAVRRLLPEPGGALRRRGGVRPR